MGTISVTLPTDGTTADVADINTPFTTIVNAINGNIDNDNISASAGISGAKLADASVTISKITNPYTFSAYQASSQTYADGNTIKLDTEGYDTNSNFNVANYTYTVPVTGIYHIDFSAYTIAATTLLVGVFNGASLIIRGTWSTNAGSFILSQGSADVKLTANDTITLRVMQIVGATKTVAEGLSNTYMNGRLVSI